VLGLSREFKEFKQQKQLEALKAMNESFKVSVSLMIVLETWLFNLCQFQYSLVL
jgi:hypothetical protein